MIKKYCIFPVTLLSAVIGLSSCYGNTNSSTLTENISPTSDAEKIAALKRHSYELGVIDVLIDQYHYKDYKLDNAFSRKILESYIKELDPNRLYFTKADIVEFNRHRDKFDDDIKTGNLEPALTIFNTYQQRVKERSDFAAKRVSQTFSFSIAEDYLLDRSKANWAKDVYALNDLWRRRIKNDLINQQLSQKNDESIATLKKRYQNLSKRTSQITSNETFQIIANAYAAALEPHTSYFSPRASEEFNIQMRLSLDGIGAVLRTDKEHTQIVNVVPGGPADRTGAIKAGDRIIAIGQGTKGKMVDVVGWRLSDVVNIIRGQKGSTVVLSVLPSTTGLSGKSKKIAIVRDKIKLEYQAAKKRIIEVKTKLGQSKIGIIDLPSFYIDFEARSKGMKDYRSTTRDVTRLINELKAEKIDGLVIDLRGNGGGSLSEVISLTGLFIDRGTVVQVNDSKGVISRHNDNDAGITYNGPLAVMIDRGSASASEIFAGAIKDYKRGIILGETTFGKGTVQTILPLNAYSREQFSKPLGQIKITTAQFFRINGESTQFHGVKPDISWPVPKPKDEFGERSLDNALPWKKIAKVNYPLYPSSFTMENIQQEDKISKKRIADSKKFQATISKMKLLVSAGNEKKLSLNLATRKDKRKIFNSRLLEIENQLQTLENKPTFKTIADLQKYQEKRNDDIFNTVKRPADVFVVESANILNDLRIMSDGHVAKR
ncbi:MAG: carboxy terminal-processing peptidase [Thiotrichaceae bacterium]|nr:carboxy terminal-processing peptidase [Thiotrichaceae bacterium]